MAVYVNEAGVLAPVLFLATQIALVVMPFFPSGFTCLAGVLLFGPVWGFIYNYIGVSIGSSINFLLGRYYGAPFVKSLTRRLYDKYIGKVENSKRYPLFFTIAILSPGFPDDILCMITGLSSISFKRFLLIILTCKPLQIAIYSLFWYGVFK